MYIVRTDQNPLGSCQPFSILYIMMTACAAAYWATVLENDAMMTSKRRCKMYDHFHLCRKLFQNL